MSGCVPGSCVCVCAHVVVFQYSFSTTTTTDIFENNKRSRVHLFIFKKLI